MKMLLAILLGNIIYIVLMPHLPTPWMHRLFRFDPGILLDLTICAAVYIAVRRLFRPG